jgi:hypothetical protein
MTPALPRLAIVLFAGLLGASACSTGPAYTLHGGWILAASGTSVTLELGQHGSGVAGYDLSVTPTAYPAPASELVCGVVRGKNVNLYLPPDSTSHLLGTFENDSTILGTLTTSQGTESATLSGTVITLSMLDGINGVIPPTPPTHC